MKNSNRGDDEVRRLCRNIERENDREKLQQLIGKLQDALQEEERPAVMAAASFDNPFDKIMV